MGLALAHLRGALAANRSDRQPRVDTKAMRRAAFRVDAVESFERIQRARQSERPGRDRTPIVGCLSRAGNAVQAVSPVVEAVVEVGVEIAGVHGGNRVATCNRGLERPLFAVRAASGVCRLVLGMTELGLAWDPATLWFPR